MKTVRLFSSLLFAAVAATGMIIPVEGRTLQSGIVKEYNEQDRKTPLAGVTVQARKAAATVSESDGSFRLDFLTGTPGERVNIRKIDKPGYEIFNTEALEQWNMSQDSPFIIIMCKSDRLKRLRDNYERVSSASYARQFEVEQARLEKRYREGKIKQAEYEKKLSDLQDEYERQLDNIQNYVDRFARIDLSELSDAESEIIALVQAGELEKAIEKYESQNFVARYAAEVRDIARLDSAAADIAALRADKVASRDALREGIGRQIKTLKLAGGRDNYMRVSQLLRDVYLSDTTDLTAAIDYAYELNETGDYQQAAEIMASAARTVTDPMRLSEIYLIIGNSMNRLGDAEKAIETYQTSLRYVEQSDASEETKTSRINSLRGNLSVVYNEIGMNDKAVEWLLPSVATQPEMSDTKALDSYIRRLNSIGITECARGNYESALSYLTRAMELCDSLPDTAEYKESRYMLFSTILNSRANVYLSQEQYENALQDMKIVLSMKITLSEKFNPDKYKSQLATAYYNLSLIKRRGKLRQNPYSDAQKATELRRELLMKNPYSEKAAENYINTVASKVEILLDHDDNDRLKSVLDGVIATVDSLPAKTLVLQGRLNTYLAAYYRNIKDHENSFRYSVLAVNAFSDLSEYRRFVYRKDLASSAQYAALQASHLADSAAVVKYLDMTDLLVEELKPQMTPSELLSVYNNGLFSTMRLMPERAVVYIRKMQELAPKNPQFVEYEAIFLDKLGREDEARDAFRRLIKLKPDYPDNPLKQKYGK